MIGNPPSQFVEPTAGPRVVAGFAIMCVGMFMAILDVQVVVTSLPTIQRGARHCARPDELGADGLSHRRGGGDSADRLSHPALTMRRPVRRRDLVFTVASIGCAASTAI